MKLHVPFRMPETAVTRSPVKLARSARRIGIPPATAASMPRPAPFSRASACRWVPCRASSILFAVTTLLPAFSAARMRPFAGSIPPSSSTTRSTLGSVATEARSSVQRTPAPRPGSRFRSALRRATATRERRTPRREWRSGASLARRLANARPTVPKPIRPTRTVPPGSLFIGAQCTVRARPRSKGSPRRTTMPASAILPLIALLAQPQAARPQGTPAPEPARAEEPAAVKAKPEEPPIVTHHELSVGGRVLRYTATTGLMPLKNEAGDLEAHMFYVAYTLDRGGAPVEKRPLMFSFNGGPGASWVWLHLGALGPKRVKMKDDGMMPAPPYALVDNEETWLTETDLAYRDPRGTGFSMQFTGSLLITGACATPSILCTCILRSPL